MQASRQRRRSRGENRWSRPFKRRRYCIGPLTPAVNRWVLWGRLSGVSIRCWPLWRWAASVSGSDLSTLGFLCRLFDTAVLAEASWQPWHRHAVLDSIDGIFLSATAARVERSCFLLQHRLGRSSLAGRIVSVRTALDGGSSCYFLLTSWTTATSWHAPLWMTAAWLQLLVETPGPAGQWVIHSFACGSAPLGGGFGHGFL